MTLPTAPTVRPAHELMPNTTRDRSLTRLQGLELVLRNHHDTVHPGAFSTCLGEPCRAAYRQLHSHLDAPAQADRSDQLALDD